MSYPPATQPDESEGPVLDGEIIYDSHIDGLAGAVNDIVAELGSGPKGGSVDLTARLAAMDAAGGFPLTDGAAVIDATVEDGVHATMTGTNVVDGSTMTWTADASGEGTILQASSATAGDVETAQAGVVAAAGEGFALANLGVTAATGAGTYQVDLTATYVDSILALAGPDGTTFAISTVDGVPNVGDTLVWDDADARYKPQAPSGVSTTVATDPIWDTKGDLAVASGADTAAKLAVGGDDRVLRAMASATNGVEWGRKISHGTSAPTSPTTGDIWFDTTP